MPDANLELVRKRFDAHPILGGEDAALAEIYAPDVVLHGPGEEYHGIDGIQQAAAITRAAFSDITFEVQDMRAEDDRVITHIEGHSRHTGPFQGAPASNRWVTVRGIVVSRIANGRIAEEWRSMTWS